jgi:hypothetical protein
VRILSIDPGNEQSAYVILDEKLKPLQFGKINNDQLLSIIKEFYFLVDDYFAIEMVSCYGMAVGKTVFETVFWIGRFWEACQCENKIKIYRKDVKMNLCGSMKAKDANIRQALMNRFGEVGTIKNKGYFYGFKSDLWSAFAIGITFFDTNINSDKK